MRASKENVEKAIQAFHRISDRTDRLWDDPARLNSRQAKKLNADLGFLFDVLKAAQRKLPTEAAFDRDRDRKKGLPPTRLVLKK